MTSVQKPNGSGRMAPNINSARGTVANLTADLSRTVSCTSLETITGLMTIVTKRGVSFVNDRALRNIWNDEMRTTDNADNNTDTDTID